MSWTTPHVFATFDVLGAAQMNDIGNNLQFLRNGVCSNNVGTSNVGPTSSTVELTLSTLVVSLDGGTKVEVEFSWYNITFTVFTDIFLIRIYDGATQIEQHSLIGTGVASLGGGSARAIVTPSAGSHTYTAKLVRSSGTGTSTLSAGPGAAANFSVLQAT